MFDAEFFHFLDVAFAIPTSVEAIGLWSFAKGFHVLEDRLVTEFYVGSVLARIHHKATDKTTAHSIDTPFDAKFGLLPCLASDDGIKLSSCSLLFHFFLRVLFCFQ